MSRSNGGKRMNRERGRVVVIPLWRKEPDIRLVAQAVVSLAADRRRRSLASQTSATAAIARNEEVGRD